MKPQSTTHDITATHASPVHQSVSEELSLSELLRHDARLAKWELLAICSWHKRDIWLALLRKCSERELALLPSVKRAWYHDVFCCAAVAAHRQLHLERHLTIVREFAR